MPADEMVEDIAGEHAPTFAAQLARSDVALTIAPETDDILARLSAQALAAGACLLGSLLPAVALAGDKWACYQRFRQADLPSPLTRLARFDDSPMVARQVGYPLVTKPVDGVGCEGVCLVAEGQALPLRLNGQEIVAGWPFIYGGGVVSLAHPAKARAFAVAQAAVELLASLQGYVGVDLSLADERAGEAN